MQRVKVMKLGNVLVIDLLLCQWDQGYVLTNESHR